MSISAQDVNKVARLARIKMNESEISYFQTQLSSIMNMIDQIKELDCENTEPFHSPCKMGLRLRDDEVVPYSKLDDIFQNSPGDVGDLSREIKGFIVPKVVE
ncbi:MAG: Asp-tRNA(Asn)/Glu-tRNA(Gln) amidotransferase subunit GatC [Rickettsiaceae bacterium]|nr:Asp-tRNA(Asn)/Glu-tRNA(Gln) amidotransferase subunit GatC [Rickettsiaceae bacterium]